MIEFLTLMVLLITGHYLADFWMQSKDVARMKNRNCIPENIPPGQKLQIVWPHALTSHAVAQGFCVGLVTMSIPLGIAEAIAHGTIDFGKCENWYGIHLDQFLHFLCKLAWAGVLLA